MPNYWGKQIFAHERFPEVGQKQKTEREKERNCIHLLIMSKYWGKQIFAHGSFPEVGQKQKTESCQSCCSCRQTSLAIELSLCGGSQIGKVTFRRRGRDQA